MGGKVPDSFADLLKQSRTAGGMTQEELAERAGLSARGISDLERGLKRRPHAYTVGRLVQALNLTEVQASQFQAAARALNVAGSPDTPTQIRTFLIADVRGYTAFTHEHGDEAAAALSSQFSAVAREVVQEAGGELVELRGDEVLAAFVSARGALQAALLLQQRLAGEMERDPSLPLAVGIGLDAGEAVPVEGGYRGGALNLAARLCSLAGPGEVFASEETIHLARAMDGLVYLDRGTVLLKGLPEPVRILQVAIKGTVPDDVPRFSARNLVTPLLPVQSTPFIGRKREVYEVATMLRQDHIRVLTLSGPGGTGKTRLAVEAAGEVAGSFADGVIFVPLEFLGDPDLVSSSIARALGVKETGTSPLLAILTEHLQSRELLLLLDNFEQVLPAADALVQLSHACPGLKILVTSRTVLRVSVEHEYHVLPLDLPRAGELYNLEHISRSDSIQLFLQRARAVKPQFELTNENASVVVEICRRLDGLPLAIELAAARIRLFPPQALLARLQSRLALLTGGPSDLPPRQQTLRNAIAWSFDLLSEEEQAIFTRFSVFVGGCTFETAEAVCDPDGEADILNSLSSLLEQSLLRQEGDAEPRFVMLETIREYALECLAARGDVDLIRKRHARHFLSLVEASEQEQYGPGQTAVLVRLDGEHDNLRAALGWLLDLGDVDGELRLASGIWRYWQRRNYFREGLQWLEVGLARSECVSPSVRVSALRGAAWLAYLKGDDDRALQLNEQCLELALATKDSFYVRTALSLQGMVAMDSAQYGRAMDLFQECLDLARAGESRWYLACSLMNLGMAKVHTHDFDQASSLLDDASELFEAIGDVAYVARSILGLGNVALLMGDPALAARRFLESLERFQQCEQRGVAESLEGLAAAFAGQGQWERAARWLGVAEALFSSIGARPLPSDHAIHQVYLRRARALTDDQTWAVAWQEGRDMPLEVAIAGATHDIAPD